MYMFLAGLGLLVIVGLHQLLESRKVSGVLSALLVTQGRTVQGGGGGSSNCFWCSVVQVELQKMCFEN